MSLVKGPRDSNQYIVVSDKVRFKRGVRFDDDWGDEFYVDFDNGVDGAGRGRTAATAFKNPAYALTSMSAWDKLYIRPRTPDVAGGDPQAITPATAANWSIPNSKYGLSIIGAGRGKNPIVSAYQTRLQGESTVTDTAPLTVLAPYVVLENLSFKRGGSTGVPLVNLSSASGAYAFASELYRCHLHMANGQTGSAGAVQIASHWYANIQECHFERCAVGIGISSSLSNPVGFHIIGNTFNQPLATNYGDIVSAATLVERVKIADNHFLHDTPTAGKARYIWFQGTCTGSSENNYFGTATLVTATIVTLSGILDSGSKCSLGFLTS